MLILMSIVCITPVSLSAIYCWYKFESTSINWKDYKVYYILFLLILFGSLINLFVPRIIKIIISVIMLLIINYIFITKRLDKCIAGVIVFELLSMVTELILVVLLLQFLENIPNKFGGDMLSSVVINFGVALLIFLSVKIKFPGMIYDYLIKTFNNVRRNHLIAYFVAIIVLASIFMILTYMKLPTSLVLICNTILIILFMIIVVKLINTQDKFNRINSKYETSIASLKQYEDIMNKYRVNNHENKNQLLTIRNMVKTEDKKTLNYIDKILEHKIKDNEKIFSKAAKIPEGGLRAIIYSKVCKMEELKINYALDISNDVKTNNLINLDEDTVLNICKILGVFLDNAIEEVQKLVNKNIIIEIFMLDDNLCVDITNNYEGVLEIDKMFQKKYTTKGKGHGYGLSLVSEILKNDSNLANEQFINKENFTQRLTIKL